MRKIAIIIMFLMAVAFGVQGVEAHSLKRGDVIIAKCIKVYDGDTLTVLYKGEKIKIRLVGIDAPELQQEYGQEAKKILSMWTLNNNKSQVRVIVSGIDKYGRVLAVVQGLGANKQWVDVATMLAWSGLAWYEEKYCLSSVSENCEEYRQGEIQSKQNQQGLFGGISIEHPSSYRQRMKNKQK